MRNYSLIISQHYPDAGHHPCGSRMNYVNATLAANLINHLQSVLNAAARSVAGQWRSDHNHITDTLASFHQLQAPEQIKFKLAVNVYQALHSTALRYLPDLLLCVADIASRCLLRSSTSSELVIPLSWLVTVGDWSFAASSLRLCNTLPEDITLHLCRLC